MANNIPSDPISLRPESPSWISSGVETVSTESSFIPIFIELNFEPEKMVCAGDKEGVMVIDGDW